MKAGDRASTPEETQEAAGERLLPQLAVMYRAFMASAELTALILLSVAIAVIVGATAYGQIQLNAWNKPFYDALAKQDLHSFVTQLFVFAVIAASLLILNVAQMWLNRMMKLKLRLGLARDLIDQWLEPGRALRLARAGELGVNPDQRIHEDAQHLTELSTDLGIGLFQASLLLVSFIGVLWILSNKVIFSLNGASFTIPGYMVWCALFYAATGSWLSWRVGRPLIVFNAERYQRESTLRVALVRVNAHADDVALYRGETEEKKHLRRDLDSVIGVMRQIVGGVTRLTWVTAGYGWFAIVAPVLVAAPGYFTGHLSLGSLMVAVGAFTQVQQSLRWFVDNFSSIADWLATLRRVAAFRRALSNVDEPGAEFGRIEYGEAREGVLTFDNLTVASPSGLEKLTDAHVEIKRGERVLIQGDGGVSLTTLFRAIAGVWPFGSGAIGLPSAETILFVPRRPYLPAGPLREALAYPSAAHAFNDIQIAAVCARVGLADLSNHLERKANWEDELSGSELQRLAFARLLLHKPRWLCMDEGADAFEEADRKLILAIFDQELAETGLIRLGRRDLGEGFSKRILRLVKAEGPPSTIDDEDHPFEEVSALAAGAG